MQHDEDPQHEVRQRICDELASGRTLRAICRAPGMPAASTVLRWVHSDTGGFADAYDRARMIGFDLMETELLDIADDGSADVVLANESGKAVPNPGNVARDRLRIETRKWLLKHARPMREAQRPLDGSAGNEADSLRAVLKAIDGRTRGLPARR